MTTTLGAYEAKTKLSELLDRVARGETITITKHGTPVAVLAPVPGGDQQSAAEVVEGLRQARKHSNLGKDLSVRELLDEGRT
jgi:prevent-host-death family protein